MKTLQRKLKVSYTIPANPQVLFDVNQRLFCVPNVTDTRGGAHRLYIKPEGLILDNGCRIIPTPEIYGKIEAEYKYQCEIFVGTSLHKQTMLDAILTNQNKFSEKLGEFSGMLVEIKKMQNLGVYMEKFTGVSAQQPAAEQESLKKLSSNNTAENIHEDKMGDKEKQTKDSKSAGAQLPPPPPPAPVKYVIDANLPFRADISSQPRSSFDPKADTLDDVIKAYVSGTGFAVQTTEGMYTGKSLLEKLEKFDELKSGGKIEIHYAADGIPYTTDKKGNVISVQTKDALYKRDMSTGALFVQYTGTDKDVELEDENSKDYQTANAFFEKTQKDLYDRTGIVIKKKAEEKSIDDAVEEAPEKPRAPTREPARTGRWAKRDARAEGDEPAEKPKGYFARFWEALTTPIGSKRSESYKGEESEEPEETPVKKSSFWNTPIGSRKLPTSAPPVRRPYAAPPVGSAWRISPKPVKVAQKVDDEESEPAPKLPTTDKEILDAAKRNEASMPKKGSKITVIEDDDEGPQLAAPPIPPAEPAEDETKVKPVAAPPVDDEDEYECPKCGSKVGAADTKCKSCGADFE